MGSCCSVGRSGPDQFARELIQQHNTYRRKHGAPPLRWSPEAGAKAQEWAAQLASTGRLQHGNHDGMGQNLAYYSGGTLTAAHTAEMWYDEYKNYSFNNPGFSSGTGHFTQMVWLSTKEIGIGRVVKGITTYVVANYTPPGNVVGQFDQNVKPPSS